ncbi:hypothetical protein QJQ45_024065, partial [Haematococcus lacustris]
CGSIGLPRITMDATVELEDLGMLQPAWGSVGRAFTLGTVAGFSKLMLTVLNTLTVKNHQAWLDAIYHRPQGQGLITIANHTSMFDDPGVISAITPWSFFWTEPWHQGNRWTMCAKEVCFKNELFRQFFSNGKTLPIVRGQGVNQAVMSVVAREAGAGGWVHVFPEGRIHFSGQLGPFKWGPGKLVCDARRAAGGRDPVVLPFFHSGMGDVLPLKASFFRVGHRIHVTVGQPLDLADLTCNCDAPGQDPQKVWEAIVRRMHAAMKELEATSPPNRNQVPDQDPVNEGVKDANKAPA